MDRGAAVHKEAADYLAGVVRTIPPALREFKELFAGIRKDAKNAKRFVVTVEDDWAFRDDWTPTRWDDWDHCWARIKVDASRLNRETGELEIWDWKTGRYRDDKHSEYLEQLDLYALGAMYAIPDVVTVKPKLVYVDIGHVHHSVSDYNMEDRDSLAKAWGNRVRPMLRDKVFKASPGPPCRFCTFAKSKGGPCTHG